MPFMKLIYSVSYPSQFLEITDADVKGQLQTSKAKTGIDFLNDMEKHTKYVWNKEKLRRKNVF